MVTDYVSTGKTIKAFEKIAADNNVGIDVISRYEWWDNNQHGLKVNEDKETIHAEPLFVEVKNDVEAMTQFDNLEKELRIKYGWMYYFYRLYKETDLGILAEAVEDFVYGKSTDIKRRKTFEMLDLENKKKLLNMIRYDYLVKNRSLVEDLSEDLAKDFVENYSK